MIRTLAALFVLALANCAAAQGMGPGGAIVGPRSFSQISAASPAIPPPPVVSYALRWGPPTLTTPTTWTVPDGDTQGLQYDGNTDLIIDLTNHFTGGVLVRGGRNIIVKPPQHALTAGAQTTNTGQTYYACLRFTDPLTNTVVGRTIHVEGVYCQGGGSYVSGQSGEYDGFDFATPSAIVQVQNSRADGLFGWLDELHSDCIQPYGGTLMLRVYNFTCGAGYQGYSIKSDVGTNLYRYMYNVNGSINGEPQINGSHSNGGYIWWVDTASDCSDVVQEVQSNAYLQSNRTERPDLSYLIHTNSCAALQGSLTGAVTFNNSSFVGSINWGAPANGDYAPSSIFATYPTGGQSVQAASPDAPFLNAYQITLNYHTYTAQNASRSWSNTPYTNGNTAFQIESGDVWPNDSSSKNRTELADGLSVAPLTPIDVTYTMNIAPGPNIAASFNTLGQFHQTESDGFSPPMEIVFNGSNKMSVQVNPVVGGVQQFNVIYTDSSDIVRGHTYSMEIKVTFDQGAGGSSLQVIRDGVALTFPSCSCTTYTGQLGWTTMTGTYFKYGWYRAASAETEAVTYSAPVFH